MTSPYETRVSVANGKYIVVIPEDGGMYALRYEEPWRDLVGDNLIYCLATELLEAREKVLQVAKERDALHARVSELEANLRGCQSILEDVLDWDGEDSEGVPAVWNEAATEQLSNIARALDQGPTP